MSPVIHDRCCPATRDGDCCCAPISEARFDELQQFRAAVERAARLCREDGNGITAALMRITSTRASDLTTVVSGR